MTIILKVYQPSNIQTAVNKKKLNAVFDEIPEGLKFSTYKTELFLLSMHFIIILALLDPCQSNVNIL